MSEIVLASSVVPIEYVSTAARLKGMISYLGSQPWFAWDTETRANDYLANPKKGALRRLDMKVDLISFSTMQQAFVVVTGEIQCHEKLPEQQVFDALKPLMESRKVLKKGYNACYSGDTEVLTRKGWVRFDALRDGVDVAQYQDTGSSSPGAISFVRPRVHRYPDDRSVKYEVDSEHLSLHVTGNHRLLVHDRKSSGSYASADVLAEKFYFNSRRRIPVSGITTSTATPLSDAALRLCVAVQADGSFVGQQVIFLLKKTRKVLRLLGLLRDLGVDYSRSDYRDGRTRIAFRRSAANLCLLNPCKQWDVEQVVRLSGGSLRTVLEELGHWDGSGHVYSSSVRENVDVMQTAAHLCGLRATVTVSSASSTGRPRYYLSVVDKSYCTDSRRGRIVQASWVGSYCVSVPSGYILVRRAGKIAVCGNSFDMHSFANYGVWVQHYYDVMCMAYLLDETRPRSLKERCKDVGMDLSKFTFDLYWKNRAIRQGLLEKPKRARKDYLNEEAFQALEAEYLAYSADDAIATAFLADKYETDLQENEPELWRLFLNHRNPATRTTFIMERHGLRIDKRYLSSIAKQCHQDMQVAEARVYSTVGKHFNIGSPKQLGEVLYDEMGLPVYKTSAKGAKSTDKQALSRLGQDGYEVAQYILEYRRLDKLYSTYLGPGSALDNTYCWAHIHPAYNPTGTDTGRLSSSDPNGQNFPRSTPKTYHFRRAFVASPGYVLLGADYSQIELRVMAHNSQDPEMLREYAKDAELAQAIIDGRPLRGPDGKKLFQCSDLHQRTADACSCSRNLAKAINFGLLYGMGYNKLAETLTQAMWDSFVDDGKAAMWDAQRDSIRPEVAEQFRRDFFRMYAGVAAYQDSVGNFVMQHGFVRTRYGQKRRLPGVYSSDRGDQMQAKRQGINTTIQGHVGELMIHNMNLCVRATRSKRPDLVDAVSCLRDCKVRLLSQIHDEVIMEAPKAYAYQAAPALARIFQCPQLSTKEFPYFGYRVPLIFEVAIGPNWADVH